MACAYYDVHATLSMLKGVCGGVHTNCLTPADQKVLKEIVGPALEEMDMVITLATAEVNKKRMDAVWSSLVKLSSPRRLRQFLKKSGKLLRYCPYCKCKGTVDIPTENTARMKRNEAKMKEWGEEKQAWEEAKAKGEVPSCWGEGLCM